jgi:hypothetical protein
MSPTERRTMSFPEQDGVGRPPMDPSWLDLPAVIRATFECTRNVALHQTLESLGASVDPLGPVRSVYPTERGSPVVTVWHDRIEADVDGSLVYRLDPVVVATEPDTALLADYVGREVYVLLLKREPQAMDPRRAGRNAPDIVMWTLEATRDDRLVLRRPKAPSVRA